MPSPFPGMDPYLEEPSLWPDFHLTLTVVLRAELNRRLPDRYVAMADRYIWIHEPAAEERTLLGRPDVLIAEQHPAHSSAGGATVAVAPATSVLPMGRESGNPFLKIIEASSRRVITVVELLSPSNKAAGLDREAYLIKRNEYLATQVNLVEMDLLRGGARLPMGQPAPPSADYYYLVCREWETPMARIWPFSVRDALPSLPVPLSSEEPELQIPLRPCLDRVYDEARYDRELRYDQPPPAPLREPDANWARELLARRAS